MSEISYNEDPALTEFIDGYRSAILVTEFADDDTSLLERGLPFSEFSTAETWREARDFFEAARDLLPPWKFKEAGMTFWLARRGCGAFCTDEFSRAEDLNRMARACGSRIAIELDGYIEVE